LCFHVFSSKKRGAYPPSPGCAMVSDALASRYAKSSEDAKRLPQKLLTNSQRLKLYALFKQAEGPAPTASPPIYNAVARAKWEAWNDVRPLSSEQAMESYCSIIEGLVAITQGPSAPAIRSDALELPDAAPAVAAATAATAAATAAAAAATAAAGGLEADPSSDEPAVEAQRWAATALSLGPGTVFNVPIVVSEPSLCRYSFAVAAADGTVVGFSIGPEGLPPLVTVRGAQHEGEAEVHSDGSTVLIAKLENGAVFTHAVVACEVVLEPLIQLAARDAHRQRIATRARLAAAKADLASTMAEAERAETEAASLREEVSAVQRRLEANAAHQQQLQARAAALRDEADALEKAMK